MPRALSPVSLRAQTPTLHFAPTRGPQDSACERKRSTGPPSTARSLIFAQRIRRGNLRPDNPHEYLRSPERSKLAERPRYHRSALLLGARLGSCRSKGARRVHLDSRPHTRRSAWYCICKPERDFAKRAQRPGKHFSEGSDQASHYASTHTWDRRDVPLKHAYREYRRHCAAETRSGFANTPRFELAKPNFEPTRDFRQPRYTRRSNSAHSERMPEAEDSSSNTDYLTEREMLPNH